MPEEAGFLTEQEAGVEISKMLETEAPVEKKKVEFLAKVKAKKPKAEAVDDKPIPLTPADGSPDPDDELEKDKKPAEEKPEEKPEGEAEPGEVEEEEKPEPRLVKVKVDGQEVEVDEEELKKGYSRTSDYTRKTQALAAERLKFEQEERAAVREERQMYAARLAALAAVVQLPGEEPNWDQLKVELSAEDFTERFSQYRGTQQRLAKIRAEQEAVAERELADAKRDLERTIERETVLLRQAMPDMADPEKAKTKQADLIAYAKSLGFPDDDIAAVTDHRLLVLLEKGRQWDESQKRKPKIEDKIDRALEAIRPSATKSKSKIVDTVAAQERLMKTGSVDDAAVLISKMLKSP